MEQSLTDRRAQLLTKRIMRRIYLIWSIRMLLHPTTLKVLIAVIFVARSTKYVSYANVFANMPPAFDMHAGFVFLKAAMHHAHPMTLVLLSSAAWLAVWIAFDAMSRRREAWF